MDDKEKINLLLDLLEKLANNINYSREDCLNELNILDQIYSNGFRHSYAQISLKVEQILDDDIGKGECLAQNLNVLKAKIESKRKDIKEPIERTENIYKNFQKLYDHVNLEIGRYNLLVNKIKAIKSFGNSNTSQGNVNNEKLEILNERINQVEKEQTQSKTTVLDAASKISNIDEKLEKNSMSSITTLTIFSAVILAFTGSITFTSGVFSGMSNVSAYRIVFITSLIGMVIFNLIFMLLFIIGRMVGKPVHCKCKYFTDETETLKCGSGYCTKNHYLQNGACMLLHKYPYILIIDLFLVCVMYYDMVLFFANNQHYLWFNINNLAKYFLMGFPIFLSILIFVFWKIAWNIVYKRCVIEVSIKITEEFFPEKKNPILGIMNLVTDSIERMFSPPKSKELDVDKICSKICEESNKDHKKVLKQQLKFYSKERIMTGIEELHYIDYAQHCYNKQKLRENINEILKKLEEEKSCDCMENEGESIIVDDNQEFKEI